MGSCSSCSRCSSSARVMSLHDARLGHMFRSWKAARLSSLQEDTPQPTPQQHKQASPVSFVESRSQQCHANRKGRTSSDRRSQARYSVLDGEGQQQHGGSLPRGRHHPEDSVLWSESDTSSLGSRSGTPSRLAQRHRMLRGVAGSAGAAEKEEEEEEEVVELEEGEDLEEGVSSTKEFRKRVGVALDQDHLFGGLVLGEVHRAQQQEQQEAPHRGGVGVFTRSSLRKGPAAMSGVHHQGGGLSSVMGGAGGGASSCGSRVSFHSHNRTVEFSREESPSKVHARGCIDTEMKPPRNHVPPLPGTPEHQEWIRERALKRERKKERRRSRKTHSSVAGTRQGGGSRPHLNAVGGGSSSGSSIDSCADPQHLVERSA